MRHRPIEESGVLAKKLNLPGDAKILDVVRTDKDRLVDRTTIVVEHCDLPEPHEGAILENCMPIFHRSPEGDVSFEGWSAEED